MTRAALLLPSLLLAACTVGELPAPGGGGDDVGNGCVDVLAANLLQDAHLHVAGGTDNHDLDCTTSGCHSKTTPGTDAPVFRFGGTIYQKDGTTPAAGGVVTFTVAGMAPMPYYADKGGNFYVMDGDGLPDPFNGAVAASTCPDIRKMVGVVTTVNCGNGSACHALGGAGGKMTIGL